MTAQRTYGREKIRGYRAGLREIAAGTMFPAPYTKNIRSLARYGAWVVGWYAAKYGKEPVQ